MYIYVYIYIRLGPVLSPVVDRPDGPLGLDARAEINAVHELARDRAVVLFDVIVHEHRERGALVC